MPGNGDLQPVGAPWITHHPDEQLHVPVTVPRTLAAHPQPLVRIVRFVLILLPDLPRIIDGRPGQPGRSPGRRARRRTSGRLRGCRPAHPDPPAEGGDPASRRLPATRQAGPPGTSSPSQSRSRAQRPYGPRPRRRRPRPVRVRPAPSRRRLQAILRHGRTRHLHHGRAVLNRDLDPAARCAFRRYSILLPDSRHASPVASTEPTRAAPRLAYADMKWPRLAPHSRASLADALATVTLALTKPASGRPPTRTLRAALYRHAFNPTRRATTTDPAWHGRSVARAGLAARHRAQRPAGHPGRARCAPAAARWPRAAASTIAATGQCSTTPPDTPSSSACSPGAAILAEVTRLRPELTAFFGCLYYAALRPEEAVALRSANLVLAPHRAGKADPHRRLPAHRLSVDQHRHAARTAASSTARTSGPGRPSPAGLADLLRGPCASMSTAPDGRLFRGLAAASSAKAPTAASGTPPARSRSARSCRHVTGLPPVRPAACRPCRCR